MTQEQRRLVSTAPRRKPMEDQTDDHVGDLDAAPLEWMLNGRMFFTRAVYAGLGAGTRMTGGYAPDFRAVAVVGRAFGIAGSDPPKAANEVTR
jgi:hypothetical protein